MKDVHDQETPRIQQHDMAADDHMGAVRWRGRQPPLKIVGTAVVFLAQTRRERAANVELFFQAGRKAVALSQAWRQVVFMVSVVPASNFFAIMVAVTMPAVIPVFVLIPILMAFASAVPPVLVAVAIVIVVMMASLLRITLSCSAPQDKAV